MFLLTGPHTFTAIFASFLIFKPSAHSLSQRILLLASAQVPNAVKASVPKLLWLSRFRRLTPLSGSASARRLPATSVTYTTAGSRHLVASQTLVGRSRNLPWSLATLTHHLFAPLSASSSPSRFARCPSRTCTTQFPAQSETLSRPSAVGHGEIFLNERG